MKIALAMFATFFISITSHAAVQCEKGVYFNETVGLNTKNGTINLDLNGIGLKKILFFKIFYGALYLENLSSNPVKIINSDQHKVGVLHVLRNASRKQMVDAWGGEFERLCGNDCEALRPHHERFISYARDVRKNERLYMVIFPDRFEFQLNNDEFFPAIKSPAYARLMQHSLYGPDAGDKSVADGLLGRKQVCP